ncbi:MAG: DUF2147 domain-containing protein [Nannocystis sp.]|nr:DUF2147 domain-containing protein [Nannocystis sp.]
MFIATTVMAFSGRSTALGYWKTIDDETGEAKSIVKIYEVDGKYYARVDRLLKNPGGLCDQCEGEDHNKPIEGMVVMWGMNADGEEEYSGGKIFDPAKNKTYRCSMWLKDGKLKVRGYLGPFYRTQTWHAVD